MKHAGSSSLKTRPMPEQTAVLDYLAEFTKAEFGLISQGLVPREMEDKWFIFLRDNTLCLHRSWTGICIFEVDFERTEMGYAVRRATVNRCSDQYGSTNDLYDARLLHFLIANFLLGRREPFPLPHGGINEGERALFQHHISGTRYPDAPVRKKPKA